MLWKTSQIVGYSLRATDGAIGAIDDLLFDDREWTVRWVVVDTGTWLPGRKVLLPPSTFGEADVLGREIPVDLSRQRIEESPGIESDRPVSRQVEADLYGYYGAPTYWEAGARGMPEYIAPAVGDVPPAAPGMAPPDRPEQHGTATTGPVPGTRRPPPSGERQRNPHLRSAKEVIGYYIQATDGDIGHVEDIFVEAETWVIRYLMVDTRNWWPGRMVLVSAAWASDVSWSERKVFVDVTRDCVRESPEYHAGAPVDRAYEERLHGHYGYPPYWQS